MLFCAYEGEMEAGKGDDIGVARRRKEKIVW